jgi:hypothetical protein
MLSGEHVAQIHSLIGLAKFNDVDPEAYLRFSAPFAFFAPSF